MKGDWKKEGELKQVLLNNLTWLHLESARIARKDPQLTFDDFYKELDNLYIEHHVSNLRTDCPMLLVADDSRLRHSIGIIMSSRLVSDTLMTLSHPLTSARRIRQIRPRPILQSLQRTHLSHGRQSFPFRWGSGQLPPRLDRRSS